MRTSSVLAHAKYHERTARSLFMAPSGQCIDIFVATYSCGTTLGAFSDFLIGSLSAATGRKMRFTGTTVLRLQNGNIVEEIGLDETAVTQLGLLKAA